MPPAMARKLMAFRSQQSGRPIRFLDRSCRRSARPLPRSSSGTVLRRRRRQPQLFFLPCGVFERLFENLRFQRLLAQEPMKFANLVLQSPIIRSRHDLFPTAGRGQAALRHQPTPGEQLVRGDAMPTSHQAYRHTRLEGLFDHANLLRGRPAPTTLNRRDDLNAIGRIGHRHWSDNGPEFVAEAVQAWITAVGAKTVYIERGSPWENGYVESFNARLRDELLNGEIFYTLREARIVIESWRCHYNTIRPHASLGYKPPAPEVFMPAFAAWPAALRRPASPATLAQPPTLN